MLFLIATLMNEIIGTLEKVIEKFRPKPEQLIVPGRTGVQLLGKMQDWVKAKGERIVIVFGAPIGVSGTTNSIRVHVIS